ncbi:MAG: CPBP family intramembrane metalloprotease [Anaerolineae bacterium]|nr:CPBP family intramembrane metalloprotease [Anaerolineae bacterium]
MYNEIDNRPRISPPTLLAAGAGLGVLMIGLAVVWIAAIQGRDLAALFPPAPWGLLAAGILAGAGFAAVQWVLFRRTALLRAEVAQFEQVIDFAALRWYHVAVLAMLAAVPEELLFRGGLVPDAGLIGAALLFGLAHALSWRYFVYASAAGMVLGLLMLWTGNLWAPIAAHAVIDAIILTLLVRRRPAGGW